MTTLGKVLVFVNLIFSLGVGYLGIMSYTARTHWAKAAEDYKKNVEIAQASNAASAAELTRERQESAAEVAQANDRVKSAMQEVDGYKTRLAGLGAAIEQQKTAVQQAQASFQAAQEEARRRQADVVAMQGTVKQLTEERQKLVESTAKMRDDKVAAEITARQSMARATELEKQVQEDNKLIKSLQERSTGSSAAVARGTSNPPPEDVEGRVVTADAAGYLKLSIGSDSGLAKGHTLQLFRLSPQAKYLGQVRILDVTPHEAVAQPVGRLSDKPVAGDRVRSRI